jgi:hypothetical protein
MKIPFYERLLPKSFRLNRLKSRIIKYLSDLQPSEINFEQKEVLNYLNNNDLDVFPYSFRGKYKPEYVEVHLDEIHQLHYMIWEGKKLYYKNGTQFKKAQKYFNSLLMEQDMASPHRF